MNLNNTYQYALAGIMATALSACVTPAAKQMPPALVQQWVTSGLDSPESVIPSTDTAFYYVSNVNGEGDEKDSNGYIAQIGLDGAIIEQQWATGLNAPKGLALSGSTLYVSDIDHLVLIDTATGDIKDKIKAEGAGFLNDVTATANGVLIADSGNARIYKYADGRMSIWMEDEQLSGVNGLLSQDERLLVTTMSHGELLSVDWDTKTITSLASGMKNADGLAELPNGTYIVSSWPGILYHVDTDGTLTTLLDNVDDEIFKNDFYLNKDTLVVPSWKPGTLTAYKLVS